MFFLTLFTNIVILFYFFSDFLSKHVYIFLKAKTCDIAFIFFDLQSVIAQPDKIV